MLTWQTPPPPIDRMLDRPIAPAAVFSPDRRWLIELGRPGMPTLTDLARPEVALAGLQLDPATHGPSNAYTYRNLAITELASGKRQVVALPEDFRASYFRWSLDGQRLALARTVATGLELWLLELATATARPLSGPLLNATYGAPCRWLAGDQGVICKFRDPQAQPPELPPIPPGPIVEENLGRKAPARTYTNLLKNAHDEALFKHYLTSRIDWVALDGTRSPFLGPALYDEVTPSPDGQYFLVETIEPPFSYQVPIDRFPRRIGVVNRDGKLVYTVAELPLADSIPVKFGSVRPGRREVTWRADRPATLYWIEALDGGDAGQAAAKRDAVYLLDAPFSDNPVKLWESEYRFSAVQWGHETFALAYEWWYDNRKTRTWQLNPADPSLPPKLLIDRNYQDAYSDPGNVLTEPGPYGWSLIRLDATGGSLLRSGNGASPEGIYPFLDRFDLATGQTERLWRSRDPYFEQVVEVFDDAATRFATVRQSPSEPPNYFLYDRSTPSPPRQLTHYPDPLPEFAGVTKEIVRYERPDGVPLSATLYLPAGYDPERDGRLPMLFWVYPEEFADRATAGQVTKSSNTFSRPRWDSVLYLLTQGYGVLLDPKLPIVGDEGREPNDTYIEQLTAGAKAAVEYVVETRGVADRDRLVVGGHSYGAFTVVNLLAHTELFRAGIARSGAYNRTLTPFGFQGEQRTYWDSPETYAKMSPFSVADRINEPLLLIHGQNDSNPGTYPIQSERLYEALRGLGGTARLVMLPLEDHGYESREAISHVLWEMVRWCNLATRPRQ